MGTGNQIAKSDRGDVVQVEKNPCGWLYKQLREKSGQIPKCPGCRRSVFAPRPHQGLREFLESCFVPGWKAQNDR